MDKNMDKLYTDFHNNLDIQNIICFISNTISRGHNDENRELMKNGQYNPLTNSIDLEINFGSKFKNNWAQYDYQNNINYTNNIIELNNVIIKWHLFCHVILNQDIQNTLTNKFKILFSIPCIIKTDKEIFEFEISPWYNNEKKHFEKELFEIFKT